MQTSFTDEIDKVPKIILARKVKTPGARLVAIPKHRSLNRVDTRVLGKQNAIGPLRAWHTGVRNAPADKPHAAAIDHEATTIVRDCWHERTSKRGCQA
jgi:hypothetical protein